jgi:hypothetical protein
MTPLGETGTDLEVLSVRHARPGLAGSLIRKWAFPTSTTMGGSNKWLNRPKQFNKINYLAISRDLLHHLQDDYEPFIRHFFPNLLVLIVLIDEDIDIERSGRFGTWNIVGMRIRSTTSYKRRRILLESLASIL